MRHMRYIQILVLLLAVLFVVTCPAYADIVVQCKGDSNGDAVPDTPDPNVKCMHLASGDGFIRMADGKEIYIFGFSNVTGTPAAQVMQTAALAASLPGPTIELEEGQEFYLNLSNVSFIHRPDLFDPHTVHWHGHPNSSSIFDGLPESAISINIGATATYYYKVGEPGTFMYHCHAEAAEHMQMGMLGQLFVHPAQNKLPNNTTLGAFTHVTGNKYAYNDADGTTLYNVQKPLQIHSLDPEFHDASEAVQGLPFAFMRDTYALLNGRGYPDTVRPGPLPATIDKNGLKISQAHDSVIDVVKGQKVLLRISNLNVTRNYTLASMGIPMQVVGWHARLYRGAPVLDAQGQVVTRGKNLYYRTNSVPLDSGETADVILDTSLPEVVPGTYFLYVAELNYLSNNHEDFGGAMTEVVVRAQ